MIIIVILFGIFFYYLNSNFSEEDVMNSLDKDVSDAEDIKPTQITENNQAKEEIIVLPPSELEPPPATGITCRAPSGNFQQLWVRDTNAVKDFTTNQNQKSSVAGIFKYTGNCPADIYIEAGIPNAPLDVRFKTFLPINFLGSVSGKASACDGNVHFNGYVFRNMLPQQEVKFILNPEGYGVEAAYKIKIGAYTGCISDGGFPLVEYEDVTRFFNAATPDLIAGSWKRII